MKIVQRDRVIGMMCLFLILLIFQATELYHQGQQAKRNAALSKMKRGILVFYQALETGDVATAKAAVDQFPQLENLVGHCPCYPCDFHGQGRFRSPLRDAEIRGHQELAKLLKERGWRSVEEPNKQGFPSPGAFGDRGDELLLVEVPDPGHRSARSIQEPLKLQRLTFNRTATLVRHH